MTITNAAYLDAAQSRVSVTIDGVDYPDLVLTAFARLPMEVADWIAAGGVPAPCVAPVPDITADQARLWLLTIGKTGDDIATMIATLPPAHAAPALVLWEYRTVYKRSYPLWDQLAPAIGLTPSQMDDAFRAASLL